MDQDAVGLGLLVAMIVGGLVLLSVFFRFVPIGLWFQALVSGVKVSFLQLFFMRFRRVDPASIVNSLVNSHKAGLSSPPISSSPTTCPAATLRAWLMR